MKKLLILTPLFIIGAYSSAQNLYVQPIDGEQVPFAISERPTITFDNRIMTVDGRAFNLVDVQTLSFVAVEPVEPPPSNIVGEHAGSPLQVFPNPVTDKLHVVIPSEARDLFANNTVEIFDMSGRLVYHRGVSTTLNDPASTITIDMSPFPAGNYILRVGNQSFQIIKR